MRRSPRVLLAATALLIAACGGSEPPPTYDVAVSVSPPHTRPRAAPTTTTPPPVAPISTAPPTTTSPPATTTPPSAAPPTTTLPAPVAGLPQLAISDAPPPLAYDRDRDFGDWIDADGDCENTRAEVLIAESAIPTTRSSGSCTIATGQWTDPWSGTTTTSARAFDVDHTVPLANAWRSGAWAWQPAQRVAYANDLIDPAHLIAIPLGDNRSKGDRGPDSWRPSRADAWCAYAQAWAGIKARWQLSVTTREWAALVEMAGTC